jgi:hypothetical protein
MFRHIFKKQIIDLVIHNNDDYTGKASLKTYISNVYEHIIVLFENLKRLSIVESSVNGNPPLLLYYLQPTTCFSSTLTVLCISLFSFDDCLTLLDGRLQQLITFIVNVRHICLPVMVRNKVSLECFILV